MAHRRLWLVAPRAFRDALAGSWMDGTRVDWRPLPLPVDRRRDVYRIRQSVANGEFGSESVVLVVAPRRRSPRTSSPPAVVGKTVVAVVQADRSEHLKPWLAARRTLAGSQVLQPQVAVCAMDKQLFTDQGHRWIAGLTNRGWTPAHWCAHAISRAELCDRLAVGAGVVVYLGHGRARGWSGYRALRWHHVAAAPAAAPCGLVVAFSCDTLTRTRGVEPFGARWIASGRAASYLGWAGPMSIDVGARLAELFCEHLAHRQHTTVADLLLAVAAGTHHPEERRQITDLRLLGDPLARLPAA